MMWVMALVACEIFSGPELCVPEAVHPSVDACLPVPVGESMTFSAEKHRLIFRDQAAVMISKCVRVISMVAVQASEIQTMGKKHIQVSAEGKV